MAPIVSLILFAAVNRWWYGGWAQQTRYIYVVIVLLGPFAGLVLSSTEVRKSCSRDAGDVEFPIE